jgi:hypothetical protein
MPLSLQPLVRYWLIPFPDTNGWIVQEAAQSSGDTQQLRRAGDLPSNLAQMHRAALVDSNHQPDEVAHLRNSLTWSQFTNSLYPSMIELVYRHWASPRNEFCHKNKFTRFYLLSNP